MLKRPDAAPVHVDAGYPLSSLPCAGNKRDTALRTRWIIPEMTFPCEEAAGVPAIRGACSKRGLAPVMTPDTYMFAHKRRSFWSA